MNCTVAPLSATVLMLLPTLYFVLQKGKDHQPRTILICTLQDPILVNPPKLLRNNYTEVRYTGDASSKC